MKQSRLHHFFTKLCHFALHKSSIAVTVKGLVHDKFILNMHV